jgi:hypothetical protein
MINPGMEPSHSYFQQLTHMTSFIHSLFRHPPLYRETELGHEGTHSVCVTQTHMFRESSSFHTCDL